MQENPKQENPKLAELLMMSVKTEEKNVVLHFTPQQLTDKRKAISDMSIELMKAEDAFDVIKAEHQGIIKPLKESLHQVVREVHRGFEEKMAMCYLVPDQDAGRMDYVLEDGSIAMSRPLLPEERQLNLYTKEKGANT